MNKPTTITCQQLEGFVVDFLDNALPNEQHIEFVRHIEHCPGCDVYLKNYRKTIALTKASQEPDCDTMPEALVQAILASKAKPSEEN